MEENVDNNQMILMAKFDILMDELSKQIIDANKLSIVKDRLARNQNLRAKELNLSSSAYQLFVNIETLLNSDPITAMSAIDIYSFSAKDIKNFQSAAKNLLLNDQNDFPTLHM
eukprot:TRINITY_DN20987_c0_g1_i1.p1 TRINITY_DN20987_c0_g1~~TRINITY_DN20987_c0_g1_i1.p1  ORF type:complete len:113 (-),score=14.41 TRINITY_DN20987_c0_g1_i1:209-547(-)